MLKATVFVVWTLGVLTYGVMMIIWYHAPLWPVLGVCGLMLLPMMMILRVRRGSGADPFEFLQQQDRRTSEK